MKEPFSTSEISSSILTEMDIDKFIVDWLVTHFIPLRKKTIPNEIWRNLFVEIKKKGSLEFDYYQQVKKLFESKLISHLDDSRFALTLTQIEQLQYGKFLDLKNVRVQFFSNNQKGYISDLSTSDLDEIKAIVEYTRLDEFSESCFLALKSLSKLNYMINVDDVRLDLCAIVKRKLVNTTKNKSSITNDSSVMPSSSQNSFKNTDSKSAQLELERTDRGVNIIVTGGNFIEYFPDRCRIIISSDRIEDDLSTLDATINQLSSMTIKNYFKVIRSKNGETQIIDLYTKNYKIRYVGKDCFIFIPADTNNNNNKTETQNRTSVTSSDLFLIDSEPDSPSFPVECNKESQLPTVFDPSYFSTQVSTDLPLPVEKEPNNLHDLSNQNKDGFSSAKRTLEGSGSSILQLKRKKSDTFETSSTSTSNSVNTVIKNVPLINKPAPLSVKLKRFSKSVLSDKDSFHDCFERVIEILKEPDQYIQEAAEHQRSQNITVSRAIPNYANEICNMYEESEVESLESDDELENPNFEEFNEDVSDSALQEMFSEAMGRLNEIYGGEPTVTGLFLSGLLEQAGTGQLNNPQQVEVDDDVHNNTENSSSSEESEAPLMLNNCRPH